MLRHFLAFAFAASVFAAQSSAAQDGSEDAAAVGESAALEALLRIAPPEQATQCLTRSQAIADQVMRMHTELLVTTLACGDHYEIENLLLSYQDFTMRQGAIILDAQGELERMMARQPEARELGPQRAFDRYRTAMANAEVQVLELRGITTYCEMRRSRFNTLMAADNEAFDVYTLDLGLRAYSRQSGCED